MGKKSSLFHQLVNELKQQQTFGQSKHSVKHEAINRARAEGKSGREVWDAMNKAVFHHGIFSWETYRNYRKVAREFADWCKPRGVRDLVGAKEKVPEYLDARREEEKSAWTLKLDRAALRKIFRDQELAKEIELPKREKENITRSRGSALKFIQERDKDAIDFVRATGLRRRELANIRFKDVYKRNGKVYVYVERGKGGKEREVPVVEKYASRVLEVVSKTEALPGEKIFSQVPTAGLHTYRREYAQERYRELSLDRIKDIEKDRDMEIIREISHNLGHYRTDVVITHYL